MPDEITIKISDWTNTVRIIGNIEGAIQALRENYLSVLKMMESRDNDTEEFEKAIRKMVKDIETEASNLKGRVDEIVRAAETLQKEKDQADIKRKWWSDKGLSFVLNALEKIAIAWILLQLALQ